MASLDVIRTITIRAREEGIDAVAKALGVTVDKANALTDAEARLHAEMGKGVTVVRESAGGIISVSREYDRLVRQVDASANAQFKMANAQRIAGRAFAQGKIDVDQHARTLELAAQKYKLLDTSNDNIGKSFQLAGHQVQNLRYQLMDVAQSLAGGMSPLQVLMQQGGQIAGVFGPGTGLTGIMRGFAQAIPRSVAIGGIPALATAAVGFSVNREQEEQQETRRSLRGTGRGSGLSPADIERLTGSGFLGSSSGLSVSQARDIATDIAATGQGSEAGIGKALALAQRLRGELGASYDDTRKLLVGLFGDTEKTYDQLDRTFGTATDASRQFVRSLVDQGRAGDAAMRVLAEIEPRLGKYADTTTLLGQATQWANRIGSDAIEKFTKSTAGAVGVTDHLGTAQEQAADKARRLTEQLERQLQVQAQRPDALVTQLGIENQIAGMNPLQQAIVMAQRSAGVGPALSAAEQKTRLGENEALRLQREAKEAEIANQVTMRNTIDLKKTFVEQGRVSALSLEMEIASVGRAAAETDRLRFATQAYIQASAGGKAVSAEVRAEIDRQADSYARLTDTLRRTQIADQIRFDRSQLGRDSTDQAIATQLRPLGGIEKNPEYADALRLTAELNEFKSALSTGGSGFISAIRQGQKPGEAAANMAGQMADRMIARTVDQGISGLFKQGMSAFGLDKIGLPGTTTGTMTVTAASVVINGGMGAGAGLPAGTSGMGGLGLPGANPANPSTLPGAEQPSVTPWPVSSVTSSALGPARESTEWDRLASTASFLPRIPGLPVSGSIDPTSEQYSPLQRSLEAQASRMAQAGDSVTGALDKTASGIGSAGDGLASAMGSAIRGLTSGAGGLFGGGDGGGGGGYAYGGYTGDGGRFDPAGIVHRGEYVFSASAVDRIGLGVLDVWHRGGFPGYDKGGYVTPVSLPPMAMLAPVQAGNSNAAPIVNHTIINQSGAQVETRESRGPNGEINMETFIRHAGRRLAGEMTDGRGALRRAVQNEAQGGSAALVG